MRYLGKRLSKICDKENCFEIGEFKAPKSRKRLNDYYFFCINHIKEYNKSGTSIKVLLLIKLKTL